LIVTVKQHPFPRDLKSWLSTIGPLPPDSSRLLVSRFLSPGARALLEDAEVNSIDMTGNMAVRIEQPSALIIRQGAAKDPQSCEPCVKSLRGAKAARVIRTLCDYREPTTSRSVAMRSNVTPGYVSKLIGLLERDTLVEREGRGPARSIVRVRWADLIRRWAGDYRLLESNSASLFLAPQGIPAFLRDLAHWSSQAPERIYAVTGSLAAREFAPIAPPSLLTCYVSTPIELAAKTGLVRATDIGNIYLCEALDPVVFERTWSRKETVYAALSQVAADCLGSPDRMPAEGDALLAWMTANERSWRLDV